MLILQDSDLIPARQIERPHSHPPTWNMHLQNALGFLGELFSTGRLNRVLKKGRQVQGVKFGIQSLEFIVWDVEFRL